jgi:ABC-2 type transport system permease protein
MTDTLASEWLKLRTLRSTFHCVGAIAATTALCVLWSWFVARHYDGLPPARRATLKAAPPEQFLVLLAPICMGVLGVLTVTSEYATGMIRASLAAVPRRRTLLAAKAANVGTLTLVTTLAGAAVATVLGRTIVGDRTVAAFHSPVSDEVGVLLAMALSVTTAALVGLGLGVLLRSTAGAITVVAVLWFVLPIFANLLPPPWKDRVAAVLPAALAPEIAHPPSMPTGIDHPLPPAVAAVVMVAYPALALGVGAVAINRRDA